MKNFVIFLFCLVALVSQFLVTESFSRNGKSRANKVGIRLSMIQKSNNHNNMRILIPFLICVTLTSMPVVSSAYWNEQGEWMDLKESSVQEVWGERLKKASTMRPADIFMSAKGAGNNDKRWPQLVTHIPISNQSRGNIYCCTDTFMSL